MVAVHFRTFFCLEKSIFYATTKSTILNSKGQIYLTFKISILTFHSKVKLPTTGHILLSAAKLSIYSHVLLTKEYKS